MAACRLRSCSIASAAYCESRQSPRKQRPTAEMTVAFCKKVNLRVHTNSGGNRCSVSFPVASGDGRPCNRSPACKVRSTRARELTAKLHPSSLENAPAASTFSYGSYGRLGFIGTHASLHRDTKVYQITTETKGFSDFP